MTDVIKIQCKNPAHPSKVANIETYVRVVGEDGESKWMPRYAQMTRTTSDRNVASAIAPLQNVDTGKVYMHMRFYCKLCRRTVAVRERARLWAVLDRLAENGIKSVDMNSLHAIMP